MNITIPQLLPSPVDTPTQPFCPPVLFREFVVQSLPDIQMSVQAVSDDSVIVLANIENGSSYPRMDYNFVSKHMRPLSFVWWIGTIPNAIAVSEWNNLGLNLSLSPSDTARRVVVSYQWTKVYRNGMVTVSELLGFAPTLGHVDFAF